MDTDSQHGYVGTVVLLVSVAILAIVWVRWYTAPSPTQPTPESSLQPNMASGSVPVNQLERYRADIDAAKAVQGKVDVQTATYQQDLGQ
jgi:hypothetical protein